MSEILNNLKAKNENSSRPVPGSFARAHLVLISDLQYEAKWASKIRILYYVVYVLGLIGLITPADAMTLEWSHATSLF